MKLYEAVKNTVTTLSVVQVPQNKTVSYEKWEGDQSKLTSRDSLRITIDAALRLQPDGFDALMQLMEEAGCWIKRGAHVSIKPPGGERNIRLDSLGAEYSEVALRKTLDGQHVHIPKIPRSEYTYSQVKRLIDIETKLRDGMKGRGYIVWAERNNIDAKAQSIIFLKEHNIGSIEELDDQISALRSERNSLYASIREKQNRMKEINQLRQAIRDYRRTKDVYAQYKASGWSPKFYNEHRAEIEDHKKAQAVYSSVEGKMPTLKELSAEYEALKSEKEADDAALEEENCSCPAGNPRLAEGRRLKIMARRRANGEGSIRKRSDGSWEGRITIGYDPFGKQVMKSVYGRTQRDVKEKLERLKADLEGKSAEQAVQSDSDSGKDKTEVIGKEAENTGDGICMLTLEQWLDIWRKQYLSNVKPGTVCHYESVCRLHIVPALGNIPLVKLRTPAIQKFYIDLQEKGLSPKYIKNIHGCLHKALDIAVRIDYITKNPTSACIIPRVIQKEMHPLDAPEQVQLLQSLKGKKNEALIVTALFTGMRAGELLGLTWDNVDFDHGVIHIVKQLTQSRGEGHPFAFGTLKNGKTRSINPAPFVLVTLKAHKEYQEEQKRIAGDLWNEGKFPNLVFTHADGSHLSQPTIWKAFQKALEDAGLNHHRLHDCRHTFAVNSIRAGDDIKTIQENMGHYSAAFTLDRYGHVTETMRQESANRMQAFIQGISGNGGGNA